MKYFLMKLKLQLHLKDWSQYLSQSQIIHYFSTKKYWAWFLMHCILRMAIPVKIFERQTPKRQVFFSYNHMLYSICYSLYWKIRKNQAFLILSSSQYIQEMKSLRLLCQNGIKVFETHSPKYLSYIKKKQGYSAFFFLGEKKLFW